MKNSVIKVAITGGAGQINYSLLFRIASGEMFGTNQKVALSVLELPVAMKAMEGVAMELEDCAFPLLDSIELTDDPNLAMKNVNWALLVGAKPRGPGMERNDLITENGPIFTTTGKAINNNAASDVRIVVVGNPCNTNCLIAMHNAPDVPKNRWHAMTRLDQNRAAIQLAKKASVPVSDIHNLTIWGNHSSTMVVDYVNSTIGNKKVTEVIPDTHWLNGEYYNTVAQRGAAIINARGKSSAASAASACVDAVKSLTTPTPKGEVFSSAVYSQGNPYGIPEDLIFSFPCRSTGNGDFEIVPNFILDNYLKEKMAITVTELQKEKKLVENLLR